MKNTTHRNIFARGGFGGAVAALLLGVALVAGGCGTSKGYKVLVTSTYPAIASRMDTYTMTPDEQAKVQELRDASATEAVVTYARARPAWEAVAPSYRLHVGDDALLGEQRKADWLKTADVLDRGQAAEQRYRATLGLSPGP